MQRNSHLVREFVVISFLLPRVFFLFIATNARIREKDKNWSSIRAFVATFSTIQKHRKSVAPQAQTQGFEGNGFVGRNVSEVYLMSE